LLLRNIGPEDEPPLDYYGFKIPDHFVVYFNVGDGDIVFVIGIFINVVENISNG